MAYAELVITMTLTVCSCTRLVQALLLEVTKIGWNTLLIDTLRVTRLWHAAKRASLVNGML